MISDLYLFWFDVVIFALIYFEMHYYFITDLVIKLNKKIKKIKNVIKTIRETYVRKK
jgi:hypothetical protein